MESNEAPKHGKKRSEYVTTVIGFIIVSMVLGVAKCVIRAPLDEMNDKIKEDIRNSDDSTRMRWMYRSVSNQETDESVKDAEADEVTPVQYKGLSINLPKGWTYKTYDKYDVLHYLEAKSASPDYSYVDFVSILWGVDATVVPPMDYLKGMPDGMRKELADFTSTNIEQCSFAGENAYKFDFSCLAFGTKMYGRYVSFSQKGHLVVVGMGSNESSNLSSDFSFIEKSLALQ